MTTTRSVRSRRENQPPRTPEGTTLTASDAPERSVLGRAFAVLDSFSDGSPEQSLGSIARSTGLPLATVHRVLAALVDWGAVERTGRGRYRIGLHLWRLGSLAPQGRELRDVALPHLQDLLEVTHEVVHLVVLDEDQALYLERLESRPGVSVVSQVGGRLPLHATGPGKVLLAHAPTEVLDRVVEAGLRQYARNTITDPGELRRVLAEIRRTGHSISRDEMTDGASSVAAPVTDADGHVIAAISVVVPSGSPLLPLVAPVRLAALGISREIGRRHPL